MGLREVYRSESQDHIAPYLDVDSPATQHDYSAQVGILAGTYYYFHPTGTHRRQQHTFCLAPHAGLAQRMLDSIVSLACLRLVLDVQSHSTYIAFMGDLAGQHFHDGRKADVCCL